MFDLNYSISGLTVFLLVLARIATVIYIVPVFSGYTFPARYKVLFSVILSLTVYILISPGYQGTPPGDGFTLLLALIRECGVGLIIGITTGIVFYGVMLAGRLIGNQMGIGLASVVSPSTGGDLSLLSQFYFMFAAVLFVTVNGHHMLISGMVESFEVFTVGEMSVPVASMRQFALISNQVFIIAVQIASSLMVLLLLITASLGIIARTVPQINIFFIGLPLRLLVGLIGLSISIPFVSRALVGLFRKIPEDLARVMGA
ncbi:MAG: flagellar biosynthetic protein FliR [Candidatus Latescibacteria bacterium]|nr:flagellar biosynthetic protein FliR [bacterium]MBD3424919.1 flagellar biosynthetic protein FliR [Candidatus Latescibacterota bacterium]